MKQITVLTRKDAAELTRVATILGDAGVNIEEVDAEHIEQTGLIVLTVDRYDDALRALAGSGLRAITQDALVIRIEDRPGALATIAKKLRDAAVDVRSMHILRRDAATSLASLVTTNPAKAREILAEVLVAIRA
ncbi:MAG: hypothetical protein K1X78_01090 [Verrucomicrobiaceae bacterium]|nr:hypothetical protein [Verrucomicrobiaceae bacterium]